MKHLARWLDTTGVSISDLSRITKLSRTTITKACGGAPVKGKTRSTIARCILSSKKMAAVHSEVLIDLGISTQEVGSLSDLYRVLINAKEFAERIAGAENFDRGHSSDDFQRMDHCRERSEEISKILVKMKQRITSTEFFC